MMDWRSLAEEIAQARSRVAAMRREKSPATSPAPSVVSQTFDELDTAFEELVAAQEALRDQTEQAMHSRRLLADQEWARRQLLAEDGGFLVTTVHGIIIEVNACVGSLLETQPRLVARKALASFVPAADRAVFRRYLLDIERGGRGPYAWEQRLGPCGSTGVACQVTVVHSQAPASPAGPLLYWQVTVPGDRADGHTEQMERWPAPRIQRDIDRQVAERRRALEIRDQGKDELLATLSHEMRTPLNVIAGYASLLRAGRLTGESKRRAVAAIERNAALQSKLVADLLDVTRISSGRFLLSLHRLDFCLIVDAAVDEVSHAIEQKQLGLEFSPCDRSLPLIGDEPRLHQVVTHLLSNAIKFTPTHGTVAITLGTDGKNAILTIEDTGIGIRPEFQAALFDRFTQDDALEAHGPGGLGLGLSIVAHIVERHGGTVRGKSPGIGLGSTFTVTLPLAASA